MRVFKTKHFAKWALRQGLGDTALASTISEIQGGLIDARLGGHVVKKRVAMSGAGKRGSTRTLIVFKEGEVAFFVFGFAKNERANISRKELRALKLLAAQLLNYTTRELSMACGVGELVEIEVRADE